MHVLARRLEGVRRWKRVSLGLELRRSLERRYLTKIRIWPIFNPQPSYPYRRQFRIVASPLFLFFPRPVLESGMGGRQWKLFAMKLSAKSDVKGGFPVDLNFLYGV